MSVCERAQVGKSGQKVGRRERAPGRSLRQDSQDTLAILSALGCPSLSCQQATTTTQQQHPRHSLLDPQNIPQPLLEFAQVCLSLHSAPVGTAVCTCSIVCCPHSEISRPPAGGRSDRLALQVRDAFRSRRATRDAAASHSSDGTPGFPFSIHKPLTATWTAPTAPASHPRCTNTCHSSAPPQGLDRLCCRQGPATPASPRERAPPTTSVAAAPRVTIAM
ncbi:hypothetical protein M011DRAFT_458873 [Sporormia fimetaria CBS 119925]|uniref:Uncharacterized protein n=1 Tax=Sporormia fimetaria CBS 119925 TaxID=1340428 RepID=A0A6A6V9S1_9PLEO|nr:hypothetical protein M011DRAFT_458873 [Sporormia fimetaria CBS 119925]